MKAYYASIGPDGRLLGLDDNAGAAIERVKETIGGPVTVQVLPDEPNVNPIDADQMPALAERNAQIPKIGQHDTLSMTLEEAHLRLLPFFSDLGVKKYDTPSGMADAWIGQNYKTMKPSQDPGRPAEVMGLTLVPAFHARLAALGEGPYKNLFKPGEDDDAAELAAAKRKMLKRWREPGVGLPARITQKFTWCQGSSKECRDSCLIFTGNNAAERYNTYRKVAQSHALLNEPVAFARILVHSIEKWMDDCTFYKRPRKDMEIAPFFRMNVLSDIPWERVAPWFFEYFVGKSGENRKQLKFYDYTKVPARRGLAGFPRHYDLTFSLSGEASNTLWAQQEIDRYDSRIAVVFLAHKRKGDRGWTTYLGRGDEYQEEVPLPARFWGMPVRDGDRSDVRPHDPGRVCVGLRWKIPSSKRAGVAPQYEKMSFVTPIYVDSTSSPSGLTRPNPTDNEDLVLISAVSPRHQPIDHAELTIPV
jgi:hypothetical protein